MAVCVRIIPAGSMIGMTAGNQVIAMYPVIVEDTACAADLRIYTGQEITALTSAGPGSGATPSTPDAVLMRESFFMPFGLVLGCYVVGKMIGAILHVIRRG